MDDRTLGRVVLIAPFACLLVLWVSFPLLVMAFLFAVPAYLISTMRIEEGRAYDDLRVHVPDYVPDYFAD